MAKWQYHFDMVTPLTQKDSKDRHDVYTKVQELGKNGWEMFSVFVSRGDVWAAFKREIEDETQSRVKGAAESLKRGMPGRAPR